MNKFNVKWFVILILMHLLSWQAAAVYINERGTGEVMLIPYYTVNNDLNTLVTVNNTTDQSKAIKINIREGLNGYSVLSYNVYLAPRDAWSFVLVPTASSTPGYEGDTTALHITNDQSCAPFLIKAGQELLPHLLIDGQGGLQRSAEGFIEVIEMANVTGLTAENMAQFYTTGPVNCAALERGWEAGGFWDATQGGDELTDLEPGTGGLLAEVNLIDVANGINYSYPVLHLAGFWADGEVHHTEPGDASVSLDDAMPLAQVQADGQLYELETQHGYDAVSALIMAEKLLVQYALDSIVNGQTELVYTFPTRRYYFDPRLLAADPPFAFDRLVGDCELSLYGGSTLDMDVYDRESQIDIYAPPSVPTRPPPPPPETVCGSVFVQRLVLPGDFSDFAMITGSNNSSAIMTPASAVTENGFVITTFLDTMPMVLTDRISQDTWVLEGLPVLGTSLTRYTNAGAQEGLLAQYGAAQKIIGLPSVTRN